MNNPVMKFFSVGHLPLPLQDISAKTCDLALWMDEHLPETPEKAMGLRFLLMAKDCFVRAQSELLDDALDSESQKQRAEDERNKAEPPPHKAEPPPWKAQEVRPLPKQVAPAK